MPSLTQSFPTNLTAVAQANLKNQPWPSHTFPVPTLVSKCLWLGRTSLCSDGLCPPQLCLSLEGCHFQEVPLTGLVCVFLSQVQGTGHGIQPVGRAPLWGRGHVIADVM